MPKSWYRDEEGNRVIYETVTEDQLKNELDKLEKRLTNNGNSRNVVAERNAERTTGVTGFFKRK